MAIDGRLLIEAARLAYQPPPRSGEVLTAPRPELAQSSARVASVEEEHMRNVDTGAGAAANDQTVMYLSPKDARRRLFFIVDRFLATTAPRGSEACAEATLRADVAFAAIPPTGFTTVDAGLEDEARTILRARCAICPERCSRPLI